MNNEISIKTAKGIVKDKRRRPDKAEMQAVHAEEGDNAKYLLHNLELAELPQIDYADTDAVETRVKKYFQICGKNDVKPSVASMALALGMNRKTLYQWAKGKSRTYKHNRIIQKAYAMLEAQMVDYMQNGKINPASGIFIMKNTFEYADTVDIAVDKPAPLGDEIPNEVLEEKYKQDIINTEGTIIDEK